jgi:hypothetical protein
VENEVIIDDLNTLWMCGLPGYTPLELIDLAFDVVDLVLVALAFRDLDRDIELHRATPSAVRSPPSSGRPENTLTRDSPQHGLVGHNESRN